MKYMWSVAFALLLFASSFVASEEKTEPDVIQLRVKDVRHHRVGESQQQKEYIPLDNVRYEIDIEELSNGIWQPFDGEDVKLEFVRVSPLVEKILKNQEFQVPDMLGVYKFRVDYDRAGYTPIFEVQRVSVRPLRHDQHERFLPIAYPYYISAFSMMLGLYLFSFVYLYHK
uniref:Dolichyl-diphosphooligosaccharide--protein glycosyltransferase 48 kDa subunit n=1 Tax=Ditylenchus dipsaci TaxID=166011 RepID=A0A915E990_9BILA